MRFLLYPCVGHTGPERRVPTRRVIQMQGFPAPWRVEKIPGGFLVRDRNKRPVARVYGQEKPILPDAMTLDQAKEMALTLARLPEALSESEVFRTEVASLKRAA